MENTRVVYKMEWPAHNFRGAVLIGFSYLETMDEIASFICGRPELIKKLILEFSSEFKCDFIPKGVGILRTAYVLYKSIEHNELRFINQDKSIELKIKLR